MSLDLDGRALMTLDIQGQQIRSSECRKLRHAVEILRGMSAEDQCHVSVRTSEGEATGEQVVNMFESVLL